jgi:hypothetical protein
LEYPAGLLSVFGQGSDHALWWTFHTSTGWSRWASLGGRLTSKPNAAGEGSTLGLAVVARGADGGVWYRAAFRPDRSPTPWTSLGGHVLPGTAPCAVYVHSTFYVLAVGTDRALWFNVTSDGARWAGWRSLGGRVVGDPGAGAFGLDTAVAFVRGTDNAVWAKEFTDNPTLPVRSWHSLGGRLTSGVAAATVRDGPTYLFVLGTDNQIWMATGVWPAVQGWVPLR